VHPYVRPLAMPDDLVRLPDGTVLTLAGARRPFVLRQARYFDAAVVRQVLAGGAQQPPPFALRPRPSRAPAAPAAMTAGAPTAPSASQPRAVPRRRPAPRPHGGVRA
jgi:type IV secretory pathway TraG/TraD family ATPase VirD4